MGLPVENGIETTRPRRRGIPVATCLGATLLFGVVIWKTLMDGTRVEVKDTAAQFRHVIELPVLVHSIFIGTDPLPSAALASIDAVGRHMPDSLYTFHVIVEDGISKANLTERFQVLERQMSWFGDRGVRLRVRLVENVTQELEGSPLENLGLQQAHIGGPYGAERHRLQVLHASDILRAVIIWRYGGLYTDYNNFLLRDVAPLLLRYGSTVVTSESVRPFSDLPDPKVSCNSRVSAGLFVSERGSPLLQRLMEKQRDEVLRYSLETLFPLKSGAPATNHAREVLGPLPLSAVHKEACRRKEVLLVSDSDYDVALLGDSVAFRLGGRRGAAVRDVSIREYAFAMVSGHYVHAYSRQSQDTAAGVEHALLREDLQSVLNAQGALSEAYAVHIFGHAKDSWLKLTEDALTRGRYPIINLIHQRLCRLLCDTRIWREISPRD